MSAGCDFTLIIAPETDDCLRRHCQSVLDAGGRLLGSLPDGIALTGDKLALAHYWRERGVRHPLTQLFDPVRTASFAKPWVMKPRQGAGSQATFLMHGPSDESKAALAECPHDELIVQRFVPGLAVSVALLMSATQAIPLLPARQHISNDGRFRYLGGSLPFPEPLASRAIKVALQAVAGINGLRGYVGVDLVLGGDGKDYAIEINPRLTTSYLGLRRLCLQNLAELMIHLALGETIEPPTWYTREVEWKT
jgi:predicted ATP-grasp superfamily ATP-dependent carboligase